MLRQLPINSKCEKLSTRYSSMCMQGETNQKTCLPHLHVLISHSRRWMFRAIASINSDIYNTFSPVLHIFFAILPCMGKSLVSVCLLFTQDKSLIYFSRAINCAGPRRSKTASAGWMCIKSPRSYAWKK